MNEDKKTRNFAWAVGLSVALAFALIGSLIYYANWWTFIAETRLLDLAIDAGLIKYHDHNAGFIDGVADLKYYYMSQEPISWDLIGVVIGIFLAFFSLKAVQFNAIGRLFGLKTKTSENVGAYAYGTMLDQYLPFSMGHVGAAQALQAAGAPLKQAKGVVFTEKLFVLFEILVFAVIGLLAIGWDNWFSQIVASLGIVAVASAILYGRKKGGGLNESWQQAKRSMRLIADQPARAVWAAFLSLLAFGLEDIAAYFTAMAFTTSVVVLKVDFGVLLMGVVGSYIARLVRVTPGGIGQFEWGFAAALYFGGLGFPECVAIAVLDNVFRYVSSLIFVFIVSRRERVKTTLGEVIATFKRDEGQAEPADLPDAAAEDMGVALPEVELERVPAAPKLWGRFTVAAAVLLAIFYIDELTYLAFDYWLLDSMGYGSVFSTNFGMGLKLFLFGLVTMGGGIAIPAFTNKLQGGQRNFVLAWAAILGSLGGYFLSLTYLSFLLMSGPDGFGGVDPIFGKDLSFYVQDLSAIWILVEALLAGTFLGLISAIGCAYAAYLNSGEAENAPPAGLSKFRHILGVVFDIKALGPLVTIGVLLAIAQYLGKYGLLYADNSSSAIEVGASALDVDGFWSNLHYIYVTTLVILGLTGLLFMYLQTLNKVVKGTAPSDWQEQVKKFGKVALILILADFGFKALVSVRNWVDTKPNEPVVQIEKDEDGKGGYIQNHIQFTRKAYGIDNIEAVEFRPKGPGDPVPDIEKLLNHPTIKNAPLWPGFTSYLERFIDPQHEDRILQTKGDTMVYGPTLEIFKQQQKLRTYYDFLGIDSVRYTINGEKKMFVSSVRELPLMEPVPWLAWFGQRFVMFTHGQGMIMAPAAGIDGEDEPQFAIQNIPEEVQYKELEVDNPDIYYGEGSTTMAYSNIKGMKELDYPTDQDRAEILLGDDVPGAVAIDSVLKRFVYGWRSDQFFQVFFSGLITDETRVHFFRSPLERAERVAPFLYLDSNPYAVIADRNIVWLTNALTTSDMYPYSYYQDLGDKSDERSFEKHRKNRLRRTNYVEDSVKITLNAANGEMKFYKISDKPLIKAWAGVYPDLFTDGDTMPASVRAHLTYPVHMLHVQFDDVYIYYHMEDPYYFFNFEDMWDDGDEVLGPILDAGRAIRFSIEPYNFLLETGVGGIPAAKDPVQFVQGMVFTPEKALNLRGIPIVYQDGEDYGRLVSLEVPKGYYYPGPEQADAAIDQNPEISEQISWWNRRGNDVIRGHTSTLIVDGEVIYVEPIFIRSQQNPVTQLRRVVAVFRGTARMGQTLEMALRHAIKDYSAHSGTAMAEPAAPAGEAMPGEMPAEAETSAE